MGSNNQSEVFNLDSAFRGSRTVVRKVTGQVAGFVIAQANRSRIAIHFWVISTTVAVAPVPMALVGDGIPVNVNAPIRITQRDHGDLATYEWWCAANSGASSILVVEVFACPCETGH